MVHYIFCQETERQTHTEAPTLTVTTFYGGRRWFLQSEVFQKSIYYIIYKLFHRSHLQKIWIISSGCSYGNQQSLTVGLRHLKCVMWASALHIDRLREFIPSREVDLLPLAVDTNVLTLIAVRSHHSTLVCFKEHKWKFSSRYICGRNPLEEKSLRKMLLLKDTYLQLFGGNLH